jgi:(p)ppGpp synthase/HD superfamily hydrolase
MRAGGRNIPYVFHCFDVAQRLAAVGYDDPHVLAAAILHDVVEDTDTTFDELQGRFGARVTGLVRQLTLPKTVQDHPRRIAVAAKLEFQMNAMREMDEAGRAIKIADKTSNIADLRDSPPKWSPETIRGYIADAERVVAAVWPNGPIPPSRILALLDTFNGNVLSLR